MNNEHMDAKVMVGDVHVKAVRATLVAKSGACA